MERERQDLFAGKLQSRRALQYQARHRCNNSVIDTCVISLLGLHEAESRDGKKPELFQEIIRGTYPKLYSACLGISAKNYLCSTYLQLLKIDKSNVSSMEDMPMSESLLIICLLLWLFNAFGKEPTLGDGMFAANVVRLIEEWEQLYEIGDPLEVETAEGHHRVRRVMPYFKSKLIPCTQVVLNRYVEEHTLAFYSHLMEVAGVQLDLIPMLEATPFTEQEMGLLLASEAGLCTPLDQQIVPFLMIKSLAQSVEYTLERCAAAEKELAEVREQGVTEQPLDEQLTLLRAQVDNLAAVLRETQSGLRISSNNERAANAELAALRKELEHRNNEIHRHKSDLRELAELREAVYNLASQQEEEGERAQAGDTTYPYTDLPNGIVCFGGIEGWRHRMQERFPTVCFIPVDYRYDSGILRRAPCIWINPAYFSHKMYSRIIGDARAAGIDVHYFHSRNVELSSRLMLETMRGYRESMAHDR